MHNPMSMSGRRVMVTGASTGIGRTTAILLSQLGAKVTLVGRNQPRLDEAVGQLEGDGHRAVAFDLSQGDATLPWFKDQVAIDGPFRGIAHCAGIQSLLPLRVLTTSALEEMYRGNTISAALLLRAFQQPNCFEGPASAVFVASTAAILAVPTNAAYGASKAALISMARTFAIELVPKRIRVNAVIPALVETEMVQRTRGAMTAELFDATVAKHPLGIGEPVDVANAIAFFLSDASKWVTGTTLTLDGGLSAS